MNRVFLTEELPLPAVSVKEVMRYMGQGTEDGRVREMIQKEASTVKEALAPMAVLRTVPITVTDSRVDFGFAAAESRALAKCLMGCRSAAIAVATVGVEADRQIRRASLSSPARGLCLSALFSERVERVMDLVEAAVKEEHPQLRPRFSPGYGDLSLALEREIFAFLDCPRRIGVSLTEGLLMVPTKSVCAIVGILGEE